jgi:primosomal protein N'
VIQKFPAIDFFCIPSKTHGAVRAKKTKQLLENPPKICIGTRRLLLYPLEQYNHIIFLEDGLAPYMYLQRRMIASLRFLQQYRLFAASSISIISQVPGTTLITYSLTHEFPVHLRSN